MLGSRKYATLELEILSSTLLFLNSFMINFSVFHFSVLRETIVTIYLPLQEVG